MPERIQYEPQTDPYPSRWRRGRSPLRDTSAGESWAKSGTSVVGRKSFHQIRKQEPLPIQESSFRRLAVLWRKETAMHSSLARKVMHPAYQRIIAMGPIAIPHILREMKRKPGHWFWALEALTQGETPAETWETLEEATDVWIRWGESKGYL